MKNFLIRLFPFIDILLVPFIYPSAILLKNVRRAGVHRLPRCKNALLYIGVFPIRDHYYEPQFNNRNPLPPFEQDRNLPGIEWNVNDQLAIIEQFSFSNELKCIPYKKSNLIEFYFGNGSFESGDAEYWYNLIRFFKPKRIVEVGSGNSTLMAVKAINKNVEEDADYNCKHICIEPYEKPWLEKIGVSVIREKVEDIDISIFSELCENDILFIDSSHIIRPQGDVLFLYLELLPMINRGVIVHIHDIFSPKNYPTNWLEEKVKFWNEQYILEALLSHSHSWEIIGALNYLHHNYYKSLKSIAPYLTHDREPGSFYIRKLT